MQTIIRSMATIVVLSCLISCAGFNLPGSSQSTFATGVGLFNQGKYEDAIPYFVQATEMDPEFGRAYLYLGRSQLNLRRWAEALAPLRTAYRLAPEETKQEAVQILIDALLGAGGASLAKGDLREAVALFKEAFTLAPESEQVKMSLVDTLLQSGTQLLSQGKASEAVSVFQEVTQLAPKSFQGYLGLARSLWQSGDALKALPAAQSALHLAPNSSEALSVFALLSQLRNR
jgi:tetratricopeptide (TPR) repeat protein